MDIQEKKTSVKLIIVGVIGLALSYLFKSVKDGYLPDYYFYKQNNMDVGIKFFCINLFGLEIPLTLLVFVFFTILSLGIYWFLTTKDVDIKFQLFINQRFKFIKKYFQSLSWFFKNSLKKQLGLVKDKNDVSYTDYDLELIKVDKLKIISFVFGVVTLIISISLFKIKFTYDTLWVLILLNVVIRFLSAYYCYYLSKYNIWNPWVWLLLGLIAPPVGLLLAGIHFTVKDNYSSDNLTSKKNT